MLINVPTQPSHGTIARYEPAILIAKDQIYSVVGAGPGLVLVHGTALTKRIPDAVFTLLDSCPMSPMESPDELTVLVTNFFQQQMPLIRLTNGAETSLSAPRRNAQDNHVGCDRMVQLNPAQAH